MAQTSFSKNLKALRQSKDVTQQELADAIGVTQTSVNGWERRGIKPRPVITKRLCEFFGISEDELLSEASGFYRKFHGLEGVSSEHVIPAMPQRATAPLHGMVHAGNVMELEMTDQSIPIPYEIWEAHPRAFFLRVEGTCMNKVIPEGCHVLIDPEIEPQADSIVVANFNDEYVMRRVHFGSQVILLYPESYDQWEDIVVFDGKVDFIGVVVWWQSSEELS